MKTFQVTFRHTSQTTPVMVTFQAIGIKHALAKALDYDSFPFGNVLDWEIIKIEKTNITNL